MPSLIDRNIALIGFMAAGKTQVGRVLSRLVAWPFVDIDLRIEEMEGIPIEEIFRRHGEPYFRGLESAVLRELCLVSGQIIGCGGGTILSRENRDLLRQRCATIWLKVSRPEALARLERPDSPRRPLLEGLDGPVLVDELLRARTPLYAGADFTVETDGRSLEEIAREICLLLGLKTLAERGGRA